MHVYTIQQILDLRFLYREPPYPGFSLEEACRREKQTKSKLVRGPNAWMARGSAKSTEEWVERLVQGSLNKLSASNFDQMVAKLQTSAIFSTEETLNKTVRLIFKKALEEPESSKSYAGVCYKLAEFEVSLTATLQPTDGKKHSKLRNAVVGIAQGEFQSRRKMPSVEGLTEEEIEQQRASFMRRKRANMKFIGELFMHKVLSHNTMMSIIQVIMQDAEKGGHPTSEDIEFLTELFLTIGESLDAIPELRTKLNGCFKLLEHLKDQKDVYPPRIRFKMLDLIELRRDFNWERRAAAVPKTSSTTEREPMRPADRVNTRSPLTLNSSNTPTSGVRKGKQGIFPDAAPNQSSSSLSSSISAPTAAAAAAAAATTTTTTNVVAAKAGETAGRNWHQVVKPTMPSCDSQTPPPSTESVTFEARIRSLFYEWVAECSNDVILEWMDNFRHCQRQFDSGGALCRAAAAEVVREACMTTKKDAQREASSFLIVGLFLTDDEVFDGFASALASAIEEGVLEDVPKFSERFINMLRITSGVNAVADVYYDTARILCTAYGMLHEPEEVALDTLMEFWEKIPRPTADEIVILPLPVVHSLAEMSTQGQAPLTGRIIASLHRIGLVDDETVRQWLEIPVTGTEADVVAAFRNALQSVSS